MSSAATSTAPLPRPGAEVWLEDLVGGPWTSVVVGVAGELVRIGAPKLGHQRVVLPLEEPFTMTYRVHDVPCEALARLVDPPVGLAAEGDYFVHLDAPPIRIQRRGAVRVPVQLIVHAAAHDTRLLDASSVLRGLTENVSGEGILMRMDTGLAIGDVTEVTIHCGGIAGTIQGLAHVVRCERRGTGSRPWRVAFAFRDLDNVQQDRLVRHLFERQRELRRAELESR